MRRVALLMVVLFLSCGVALAAEGGELTTQESMDESLTKLVAALQREEADGSDLVIPTTLYRHLSQLFAGDPAPAIASVAAIQGAIISPENDWNNLIAKLLALRVLKDVLSVAAGSAKWVPERRPLANASTTALRSIADHADAPMFLRHEAARLLAAEHAFAQDAATLVRLVCDEEAPEGSDLLGFAGGAWLANTDIENTYFVQGFLTAAAAYRSLAEGGPKFNYRVGVYVIELDVFYRDPANRSVSLTEAMFRAQAALDAT